MNYRSKEGDVVDAICYRYYGRSNVAAQVYDMNPGLSGYGPILPSGVIIDLPDIEEPSTTVLSKISLFD